MTRLTRIHAGATFLAALIYLLSMVATSTARPVITDNRSSASPASGTVIVAPTGHLAGRSYAQWLAEWWKVALRTQPPGPICRRVGNVELLMAAPFLPGPNRCSVPAGRPVYVNGPASECSTVEKPPSHANTDAELTHCARKGFAAISATKVTIDAHAVPHVNRWLVASPIYRFHLPKHNILSSEQRTGRSAAYGSGFLLTGLPRGGHVIRVTGNEAGHHVSLTYHLQVTSASAAAAHTTRPVDGPARLYVTPISDTNSTVLISGAIGDHGTAVSIDKNGAVDANGNYENHQ